jgi:hypothetical protein
VEWETFDFEAESILTLSHRQYVASYRSLYLVSGSEAGATRFVCDPHFVKEPEAAATYS